MGLGLGLELSFDGWILETFSWVLLFFLVERLISLIVCLSEENSKSGSIQQERTQHSATFDHYDYDDDESDDDEGDDDDDDEEFGEELVDWIEKDELRIVRFEEMFDGNLGSVVFNVVENDSISGSIVEETIEFDDDNEVFEEGFEQEQSVDEFADQDNESIEFRKMNFVGSIEKEKSGIFGKVLVEEEEEENFLGFEEKFGGKVNDSIEEEEEEEKNVGFEEKFGGKLESGKNIVDVDDDDDDDDDDDIKDKNLLGLKERVFHENRGILGEIVDDERKGENSSNEGEISGRELNKNEGISSDDEDWEGIERNELERCFAIAMNLINEESELFKGGNDVNLQLYGLQKIAMEGPCNEPQPMALFFSARAKWNAWKKLGNMSPEDAMEQYINLVEENRFEGVKKDKSSAEITKASSSGAVVD